MGRGGRGGAVVATIEHAHIRVKLVTHIISIMTKSKTNKQKIIIIIFQSLSLLSDQAAQHPNLI